MTTDIFGPVQLPIILEPEDFIVMKHKKNETLKLVQIRTRLNKGLYLLSEKVNSIDYRFLIAVPKKTMIDRQIQGFVTGKCTLVTTQQMTVIGSPDCSELNNIQSSGFVVFFYYGIARIGDVSQKLLFKEDIVKLQKPNLMKIDKSEYLVAVHGKMESTVTQKVIPKQLVDLLEFWNLDTNTGEPQYLQNQYLLMDGTNGQNQNVITMSVKKNFFPNNLRLLLHGTGNMYDSDNQLFYIDLDEDNL